MIHTFCCVSKEHIVGANAMGFLNNIGLDSRNQS